MTDVLAKHFYRKVKQANAQILEGQLVASEKNVDQSNKHYLTGRYKLRRFKQDSGKIEYSLNVFDRDYLSRAAEYMVIERDSREIPRLFIILESITIRKIFSCVFFGLVATL